MPIQKKPAYLLHKATGQARCRINGKDVYLGRYGSPESREKYDELIGEWFARNGDTSRHSLTVDDLTLLFMQFAETYYRRKNGEPNIVGLRIDCGTLAPLASVRSTASKRRQRCSATAIRASPRFTPNAILKWPRGSWQKWGSD